jgi:hypothetical protein
MVGEKRKVMREEEGGRRWKGECTLFSSYNISKTEDKKSFSELQPL